MVAESFFKYTLIIPVFNELLAVDEISVGISRFLSDKFFNDWMVTIVDDGSTDGSTNEIIERLRAGQHRDRVRFIAHPVNQGYGAALKSGLIHATTEYVAIIDADGTYPIDEFRNMVPLLSDAIMIVGDRNSIDGAIPTHKAAVKRIIRWFGSYVAGHDIKDFNSGMRIVDRHFANSIINYFPNGFSFTTTLTMITSILGLPVYSISIPYFKRTGNSKIRAIKDTMRFFGVIFKIGLYFRPRKIFGPLVVVSLISCVFGLIERFYVGEGYLAFTVLSGALSLASLQFLLVARAVTMLLTSQIKPERFKIRKML